MSNSLWPPWIEAHWDSSSFTISQRLLKLMSIESMVPFNHLILLVPFLLLPSISPASRSFPMSHLFASDGQSIGASNEYSGLISFRTDWSPCRSRDSQESSSTQFESINSFVLSLLLWINSHIHTRLLEKPWPWLYGPLLAKWCLCFLICCCSFSSKEQASFNLVTAVTIHSDFGAQEKSICPCFHFFLFYFPWSDGMPWSWCGLGRDALFNMLLWMVYSIWFFCSIFLFSYYDFP